MKSKKIIFVALGVLLSGITFTWFLTSRSENKESSKSPAAIMAQNFNNGRDDYVFANNHQFSPAKTDDYPDLASMEDAADLIVVGQKVQDLETIIERNAQGDLTTIYSLAAFTVSKTIKGTTNSQEQLTILENEGYDEKDERIYHIAGYEKMLVGNSYLLFLKQSLSNPEQFIPVGVVYGKVPLHAETSEIADFAAKATTAVGQELRAELTAVEQVQTEAKTYYADFL